MKRILKQSEYQKIDTIIRYCSNYNDFLEFLLEDKIEGAEFFNNDKKAYKEFVKKYSDSKRIAEITYYQRARCETEIEIEDYENEENLDADDLINQRQGSYPNFELDECSPEDCEITDIREVFELRYYGVYANDMKKITQNKESA